MEMENTQVKLTDIIRRDLMDYIYSEDLIDDAKYLGSILNGLDAIDFRFKNLEDDRRHYEHEYFRMGKLVEKYKEKYGKLE